MTGTPGPETLELGEARAVPVLPARMDVSNER